MQNAELVIRPCRDVIYVEQVEDILSTMSEGGVHIPDTAQDLQVFRVLAVGEGKHLENGKLAEPRLKKGDLVIIKAMALGPGQYTNLVPMHRFRKKTLLIKEEDVWAVLSTEGVQ